MTTGTVATRVANRVFYWAALGGLAWVMLQSYIGAMLWDAPPDVLRSYIEGTATRPFVYRTLVPSLVGWLMQLYPLSSLTYATAVLFVSLIGFLVAMRSLAAHFWRDRRMADVTGVAALILLAPWLSLYRHHYDLTQLFLFTLGLRLMAERRWRAYLPLFALGCLSKETTVLLVPVSALFIWSDLRAGDRKAWMLLFAQVLVFALLRGLLMWRFAENPGVSLEYHLPDQIKAWTESFWGSLGLVVCGAIVLAQVLPSWSSSPAVVRAALVGTLPILLVMWFVFGYPFEIRNLFEAYPALVLLALPTLVGVMARLLPPRWVARLPRLEFA